jgi:SAM-dependent methyltransferase
MRRISTTLSVPLPDWLYSWARDIWNQRREAGDSSKPNLLGDREIEWSWVAANIPNGSGRALDFGPGGSYLGLIAAHKGFRVTAADLEPLNWPYKHPGLEAVRGDLLRLPLPKKHFDLVLNCSTVEHVGLAGRYGVTDAETDGDLRAMSLLRTLMKPGGSMLLTIPVGVDGVYPPLARVYGQRRLPLLLKGFSVKKEEFWVKDSANKWVAVKRAEALGREAFAGSWNALKNYYGLGCFVLKPSGAK